MSVAVVVKEEPHGETAEDQVGFECLLNDDGEEEDELLGGDCGGGGGGQRQLQVTTTMTTLCGPRKGSDTASPPPPPRGSKGPSKCVCPHCNKEYKNSSSLRSHMHKKHGNNTKGSIACQESGCSYRTMRMMKLLMHLVKMHKKKFECEKVTFQKHEDFWKWKSEAEKRCNSVYSAQTSAKKMASGDVKFFFRCHRSGYARTRTKDYIRKRQSSKINGTCTSFMEVTMETEGRATVNFCRTHYGHTAEDSGVLKLSNEERLKILELITEGLTVSEIITAMKKYVPELRQPLLKYSNIRNIANKNQVTLADSRKSKKNHNCVPVIKNIIAKETPEQMDINCEVIINGNLSPQEDTNLEDLTFRDCKQEVACVEKEDIRHRIQSKLEQLSELVDHTKSIEVLLSVENFLDSALCVPDQEVANQETVITDDFMLRSTKTSDSVIFTEDKAGNKVTLLCFNDDSALEERKYGRGDMEFMINESAERVDKQVPIEYVVSKGLQLKKEPSE